MPLRDLEYQARVLTRFDEYLTELAAQKAKADKIAAVNALETDPDLMRSVPNFPAKTWLALKEAGKLPPSRARVPFSPRADGMKRPVPNVVFKVPTGAISPSRPCRASSGATWGAAPGLCSGSSPTRPSTPRPSAN